MSHFLTNLWESHHILFSRNVMYQRWSVSSHRSNSLSLRFKAPIVVLTLSHISHITHLISSPSGDQESWSVLRCLFVGEEVKSKIKSKWKGENVASTLSYFCSVLSQTKPLPCSQLSRISQQAGRDISGFLSENIYISEILLGYVISRHWKDRPPPNIPIQERSFSSKPKPEPDWMRYMRPPYLPYDQRKVS